MRGFSFDRTKPALKSKATRVATTNAGHRTNSNNYRLDNESIHSKKTKVQAQKPTDRLQTENEANPFAGKADIKCLWKGGCSAQNGDCPPKVCATRKPPANLQTDRHAGKNQ